MGALALKTPTQANTNSPGRSKAEKFEARRQELAEATLETLAELGYARTSLREIAQNSEFTHGVLHYYFKDKIDLISCGVRQYKARCVTRYDEVLASARTRQDLLDGFLLKLADTLQNEPRLHRLWYDLRSQALFDSAFQKDVLEIDTSLENMIVRVATRYAELGGGSVAISPSALYALFDGLFQKALLRYLSEDREAVRDLLMEVKKVLPMVVANADKAPPKQIAVA